MNYWALVGSILCGSLASLLELRRGYRVDVEGRMARALKGWISQ